MNTGIDLYKLKRNLVKYALLTQITEKTRKRIPHNFTRLSFLLKKKK